MYNKIEYSRNYYLRHREKALKEAKIKYQLNKDEIRIKRGESRKLETPEKRIIRLEFHKKYNKEHTERNREISQSDIAKFKMYEHSAKRRNYIFTLLFEEFKNLFHRQCEYCGKPDCRGIDRIDNKIGYKNENCVPCCDVCNKMKWRHDKQKFLEHISRIYKHNN
jgi:hypothetical protein